MAARRGLYRLGIKEQATVPVPVIVVGNVTVGGTGKTPFVIWLARELGARGFTPGIVTRGYGGRAAEWPQRVLATSSADDVGDEPVLIARRTGCPVQAGPDRAAAAAALLREAPQVDVILADDGLQHYRLARAFEIAVIDGVRGLGNGQCLPAGPLREPAARLATVDAVVIHGRPVERRDATHAGLPVNGPQVAMSLTVSRVYRLADGAEARLDAFAGQPVHALAGIGHPERFFRMLEDAGMSVQRHPLADHARIRAQDLPVKPAWPLLMTEKDAVKLRGVARADVWCVAVDAVVGAAEGSRLLAAIEATIGAPRPAAPDGAPKT